MNRMLELIKQIIESLNSCAGLLSLSAVLAAIIVPIIIYKKQRQSEKQDLQDELDAMNEFSRHSFDADSRMFYIKRSALDKKLKRR